MKVVSKLANVDFSFGRVEYKRDHLILYSHPDQPMQSKVYVSPEDILSALGRMLSSPRICLYFLTFPVHLIRYRRRKAARENGANGT